METVTSRLIPVLAECAGLCYQCAVACLGEDDIKGLSKCIKLDIDCAEICQSASAFVSRDSDHAKHLLKECAEICRRCAEECMKHSHMVHCNKCSHACLICAEACENSLQ